MQIREIGEQGLLALLQQFCPSGMIGDDAAVLAVKPNHQLIITTDVLIDGVHFSDRTTPPHSAGWRAAAANLSDLAAMGSHPIGVTIGLGLTAETEVAWVEAFYQGMTDCLAPYQTPILGGDLVRSPVKTVSITALGESLPNQVIKRSSAKPGFALVATGFHGQARAGLELLLDPETAPGLSETERKILIQAHQYPQPRLEILPTLETILGENWTEAIAGMDSSDGLADAVLQLCRASQVGAELIRSQLPISPILEKFVSSATALNWGLYGGEDFELILALPQEQAEKLIEQLGASAMIFGTLTEQPDVKLIDDLNKTPDQVLSLNQGFQHF